MKGNVSVTQRFFKNHFNYQMHIPQRMEVHTSCYAFVLLLACEKSGLVLQICHTHL